MQTRTVEQVESWDSRPFSGGFDALHEESDQDFTGAVVAGNTWLFMLNGRVVGVFEGTIDDFADQSGTVYTAPHDSLPLLFSMQERGGETRAKYFTEDTPLAEADRTLREANFTGYIELSENVLSGDYYVVYYGGKKMSAAFIGQSERLETGEDAFELAADEVGIFEVMDVSMNITEIPAPAGASRQGSGTEETADSGAVTGAATEETIEGDEASSSESAAGSKEPGEAADPDSATGAQGAGVDSAHDTDGPSTDRGDGADTDEDPEPATAGGTGEREETSDPEETGSQPGAESGTPAPGSAESDPQADSRAGPTEHSAGEREDSPDATQTESDRSSEPPSTDEAISEAESGQTEPAAEDELRAMFQEEEEWRQTRSIPALDPDETEGEREAEPQRRPTRERQPSRQQSSGPDRPSRAEVSEETIEDLKSAIDERERQIDDLASSMEAVKTERNEMEADLEELRDERDDLEERVSNLESALQRAKDQQASVDPSATQLGPEEALSGTNLFVRYDSKGKPTLEALSGGEVDPEAVNANLKLEHHTQFEAENVTVDGADFEDFLAETSSYRFVSWLVREFPYELLETGARTALGDLYEAVPRIDRIEFDGTIQVSDEEGGSTSRDFAVVVRDRMGNPLAVAELNDARDPVRGEEMEELIGSASTVGDREETFSGAFYVTASFFEPAALEEAEGVASSGGLFSRSDKKSYVKTAGKSGFHLCLVEDRDESFHVTVPEL